MSEAPQGWIKGADGKFYPPPSNGHAIGSCFLGAIALFLGIMPFTQELALIAGVGAVFFGFYARIIPVQRHLANIGIATGLLGCVLAALRYL